MHQSSPLTRLQNVTLDVAKELCKTLSKDRSRDKYLWKHASLKQQEEAVANVKKQLAEDDFTVAEGIVEHRMQTAMKSAQRRKHAMWRHASA